MYQSTATATACHLPELAGRISGQSANGTRQFCRNGLPGYDLTTHPPRVGVVWPEEVPSSPAPSRSTVADWPMQSVSYSK